MEQSPYQEMSKYTDDLIDRYLKDEMSYTEKNAFCQSLDQDPDLQSKVLLRQMIVESIRKEQEQEKTKANLCLRNQRYLRKVALLTAVVLVVFLAIGTSFKYNMQDLYAEYFYIPYFEYMQDNKELSDDETSTHHTLISLYEQKAYADAATLFEEKWIYKEYDKLPAATMLTVSICALKADRVPLAISILTQVTNPQYKEKADWLLLCCYLKEGQRSNALEIAGEITQKGDKLADKTYMISRKLKERKWF